LSDTISLQLGTGLSLQSQANKDKYL
jgi:hypothetical protein